MLASALLLSVLTADPTSAGRISSLNWVRLPGAEDCIGSVALAGAVEARLHRQVFVSASHADLAVEGRIEKVADGYAAVLSMTDSSGAIRGKREVRTHQPACRDIDASLVFVLSLMIEPGSERPAPPAVPAPAPAPILPPPPAPIPQAAQLRERGDLSLDVGPNGTLGLTPNPALGVGVTATVAPNPSLAFEAGARWLFPRTSSLEPPATATVEAVLGSLAACWRWLPARRLELGACAGAEVGPMRVTPTGLLEGATQPASPQTVLLVNPEIHLELRWLVAGPLYARLEAEGAVPLYRDTFTYTGSGGQVAFFQPKSLAGAVSLGLGVRIPQF